MINFDKIKLVLFDFDDTLCVHKWHGNSHDQELKHNVKVIVEGAEAWAGSRPNVYMRRFMCLCANANIRMGLISATNLYIRAAGKLAWVEKEYGYTLENYCVGSPRDKVTMLIALSEALAIPRDEILIIDDYYRTLEDAANAGFVAATPLEVANFIDSMDQSHRFKVWHV